MIQYKNMSIIYCNAIVIKFTKIFHRISKLVTMITQHILEKFVYIIIFGLYKTFMIKVDMHFMFVSSYKKDHKHFGKINNQKQSYNSVLFINDRDFFLL